MRKRVGDAAVAPRGKAPRDRRGPGRDVGDDDVHAHARIPRAGHRVGVSADRKRHAPPPGVEVVDARGRRDRVGEVDVSDGTVPTHPPKTAASIGVRIYIIMLNDVGSIYYYFMKINFLVIISFKFLPLRLSHFCVWEEASELTRDGGVLIPQSIAAIPCRCLLR